MNENIKLYVFTPTGFGNFSFSLIATSEIEARQSVDKYIYEHLNKEDDCFINDDTVKYWNTNNYYTVTVADIGEVVTSLND